MQAQPVVSSGVIFVSVLIGLVALGTLGMIVIRSSRVIGQSNAAARERRAKQTVKQTSAGTHPVMSRPLFGYTPSWRIADTVDNSLTAGQSHVNVNELLTGNDAATDDFEDEVAATEEQEEDKSLQYRERLRTLADLINGGVIGQAEGIEKAFQVTRSGRKDSKYAQIRADLLPLLKKQGETISPIAGRPTDAKFASDLG